MSKDSVIIKKYANRRLYNTQTSTYITLDDLYQMVKEGQDFEVVDAKTAKDITHATLVQIIFEGESNRESLMPVGFLRQLIRFYDDSLQSVVPYYLESSMQVFTQNQEKFRQQTQNVMDGWQNLKEMTGLQSLEDAHRYNLDLMRDTLRSMNPFMSMGSALDTASETPTVSINEKAVEELSKQSALLKRLDKELSSLREENKGLKETLRQQEVEFTAERDVHKKTLQDLKESKKQAELDFSKKEEKKVSKASEKPVQKTVVDTAKETVKAVKRKVGVSKKKVTAKKK